MLHACARARACAWTRTYCPELGSKIPPRLSTTRPLEVICGSVVCSRSARVHACGVRVATHKTPVETNQISDVNFQRKIVERVVRRLLNVRSCTVSDARTNTATMVQCVRRYRELPRFCWTAPVIASLIIVKNTSQRNIMQTSNLALEEINEPVDVLVDVEVPVAKTEARAVH